MSNASRGQSSQHGLTLSNKIWYASVPLLLSAGVVLYGPLITETGIIGWVIFTLIAVGLGLVTFFISAAWTFQLEMNDDRIRIQHRQRSLLIPTDRVGMLVRNGGFPFPTLWLVLRGAADAGSQIPEKGVDPAAGALIEQYARRNPGKRLSYVPIPGAYLRSVAGFAAEVKKRIPPVTLDQRLGGK